MNAIQKIGAKLLGIETKADRQFLPAEQNQLLRQLYQYIGQSIPINPETDSTQFITQGYQYNYMIYAIVSFLSRKASQVDYQAVRYTKGGKKEVIEEHEVLDTIYHPNEYQGKSEFLEQYHGFRLITGNSYLYTPRIEAGVDKGKFTEMHVMPAPLIEIVSGGMFEPIGGYKLRWGAEPTPFEPNEVMHTKYANYHFESGYQLYGMSPIQAAWGLLQKSNSNIAAAKSLFDNKGAQGVIYDKTEVSSQGTARTLTEEQYREMQSKWDKKTRGTDNRGRVLITSGDFGYIDLGATNKDLTLLEDAQATFRDLCTVYHAPSGLFNDPEGSTYNNKREERKAVWTDAIMPECRHFADELTRHIRSEYKKDRDIYIEPNFSNIEELQADRKEMTEWLSQAWWMKGTEKQEMMGIEPDPEMDKYFIPMGLIPSDEMMIDQSAFEQAEKEKLDYFKDK